MWLLFFPAWLSPSLHLVISTVFISAQTCYDLNELDIASNGSYGTHKPSGYSRASFHSDHFCLALSLHVGSVYAVCNCNGAVWAKFLFKRKD